MIRDIVIIKDGLPILTKSFTTSQSIFSQADSLLMLSGFFSAINSFSNQFDNLGSVSELKLSKNDVKLSFLRDKSLPNLVYLATFDEQSKGVNVQRALRKISRTFLQRYNVNQILNWRGRKDTFKAFEENIKTFIEEEKNENEKDFKEKVSKLFKDIKEKINEENESSDKGKINNIPNYYNNIPLPRITKKINLNYYLTSQISQRILNLIDGEKTINNIAKELNRTPEQVYNNCKNMIKLGFVSFSDT